MLVAVVTKTLALNKGEKHVHFFMLDIQISKRVRGNHLFHVNSKDFANRKCLFFPLIIRHIEASLNDYH